MEKGLYSSDKEILKDAGGTVGCFYSRGVPDIGAAPGAKCSRYAPGGQSLWKEMRVESGWRGRAQLVDGVGGRRASLHLQLNLVSWQGCRAPLHQDR